MTVIEPTGQQPIQPAPPERSARTPPRSCSATYCSCGNRFTDVVLVAIIVFVLAAVMMPNINRVPYKAKEAEVKQNLHSIQLALERYAVDNGGHYPFFLYGGTTLINIGVVAYYNPSGKANSVPWQQPVHVPYDTLWLATHPYGYHNTDWDAILHRPQDLQNSFGDALAFEGYMPKYPQNPFQQSRRAMEFGLEALNTAAPWFAGYGGPDGNLMWDLSLGMSELPQLQVYSDEEDGSNSMPGNFYYHARFSDGVTSSGHFRRQQQRNPGSGMPSGPQAPPLDDQREVRSDAVSHYDLVAVGSQRTKGMDIDNSVAGAGLENYWRTGYFTLGGERNPWVRSGDYPGVSDYGERPYSDSIPDYMIIHLDNADVQQPGDPPLAQS